MKLVEIRRVSTKAQAADDKFGLSRQERNNLATAKRIGGEIIDHVEVVDVGRTDFIHTPEWRRVRDLIQAPDVHIVVDQTDRFMADFGGIEILKECRATATMIYDSGGCLNPATFDGRLIGVIKSLIGGNELDTMRHRAQGAKEAARSEGIFPSADVALPTGIKYERIKGQAKGRWSYNESIKRVAQVYALFVDEGVRNYAEIGRRCGFSPMTTKNILVNPIYKGWWIVDEKREPGPTPKKSNGRRKDRKKIKRAPEEVIRKQVFRPKGEALVPDDARNEALIPEEVWDWVQTEIEQRSTEYLKTRDTESGSRFVYKGCLWCFRCGEPIWGRTKPPGGRSVRRHDYYVCKRSLQGRECGTKYLNLPSVNAAIDRFFAEILSSKTFAHALLNAGTDAQEDGLRERLKEARQSQHQLQAKREKLLDRYLEDVFSKAELDGRRFKLDQDLEQVAKEIGRLEGTKLDEIKLGSLQDSKNCC